MIAVDFPKICVALHCQPALVPVKYVKRQVLTIVVVLTTSVGVDNCIEVVTMGDEFPKAAFIMGSDVRMTARH